MRSKSVTKCQCCGFDKLIQVFDAGFLPPVNTMQKIDLPLEEQTFYPGQLFECARCKLVQLGYQVDPEVVFPDTYSYRSGTTKALLDNFADLAGEVYALFPRLQRGVVVEIASNDGSLLSQFKNRDYRVLGIEPTAAADDANARGLTTLKGFFGDRRLPIGKAQIVAMCNAFAHIPEPNEVVQNVLSVLDTNGVFVTESHYLKAFLEDLQYDTIYSEHLRYYSLTSIKHLLERNGMEVIRVKETKIHGGSIRVYAARQGQYPVDPSVQNLLDAEGDLSEKWSEFRAWVSRATYRLREMLQVYCDEGLLVMGVGAPSRASTLAAHCRLTPDLVESIVEVEGSRKIGCYLPGTSIPILPEATLFERGPDYVLILSWHIASDIMKSLKRKGFKGGYIVPLPTVKQFNSEGEEL